MTTLQQRADDAVARAPAGEGRTYNTGMDVLGVLLARAPRTPLPELLAEVRLAPLGMHDTGFTPRADQRDRTTTAYRREGLAEVARRDVALG